MGFREGARGLHLISYQILTVGDTNDRSRLIPLAHQ
jgi:hypothetical protein